MCYKFGVINLISSIFNLLIICTPFFANTILDVCFSDDVYQLEWNRVLLKILSSMIRVAESGDSWNTNTPYMSPWELRRCSLGDLKLQSLLKLSVPVSRSARMSLLVCRSGGKATLWKWPTTTAWIWCWRLPESTSTPPPRWKTRAWTSQGDISSISQCRLLERVGLEPGLDVLESCWMFFLADGYKKGKKTHNFFCPGCVVACPLKAHWDFSYGAEYQVFIVQLLVSERCLTFLSLLMVNWDTNWVIVHL